VNQLETKVVEYCAAAKQLTEWRKKRFFKKSEDVLHQMIEEDVLREKLEQLEPEIDDEFEFAVKTAQDWGQISGIPDMVLDVAARSAEIDWCPSRGVSLRHPTHELISCQTLVREAANASNRYSASDVGSRRTLKSRLQAIYLALGDLVSETWQRRKN